ncbi:PREDICTED: uncharacterized protein LOC105952541 [Erythranthe guttata]|uniref:uncharacterized protein LOC105952541 n=1 Tax=Erythranthe guttata TaxID=4155 RepID=UPI00064D7D69|nr:PREDICTED: uncharacterized protein LOC105952541 [Erythranthe guttata]|eukprot:XP_012831558.1 PREDICTED: uncharacterized protein LOC105952541 [Erythranthe guttata]
MDSQSTGSSVNSTSATTKTKDNDLHPLWKYVIKLGKAGEGAGGNCRWLCTFCNEEKVGSYTRVRAHLFQISNKGITSCKKVSRESITEMKKLEEAATQIAMNSQPKNVSLPTTGNTTIMSSLSGGRSEQNTFNVLKRQKAGDRDNPIAEAFDANVRNQLDAEIARMFYTAGLPFNFARNPYYVSAFLFACNHSIPGYLPPGYNKLRTTLLEQEKTHVERLLEPIKSTWSEKGVSIVSDGWSDPQRRPLINVMVVSDCGPMFIKAVDCSGEVKDKKFIASLLKKTIDEVGHQKVVQIITDNASNCKAAGELIEGWYPHIFWTPCVVHTLNLALKNICSAKNVESNLETYDLCSWITIVHEDAVQVKNFIMNHAMILAMYKRFAHLKLLSVADTRFASIVVMLTRFMLIKRALQLLVTCNQCTSYREDNQSKAKFVRDTVLSEEWWEKVSYILAFTEPIYEMIRVCDTDKPCLHLVYEMWDAMIEKVKKVIYDHEKKSMYYSEKWLLEGQGRLAPHMDGEVSSERIKCFRRFFPGIEERTNAIDEFANFSLKTGPFGDPDSIVSRYDVEPRKWWACYGSSAPLLQKLAFKVLGQPSSSSCSERNWSTYSFVHSFRRNKLNPKRAEDLVFIHTNLRLLSRSSVQYYDDKTKMWDVGGDDFGNIEDEEVLDIAQGVLDIAQLSLDEPELEGVIFAEDVET